MRFHIVMRRVAVTHRTTGKSIQIAAVYPKGLKTPREMPSLATGLTDRGYADGEVAKLLGGNWLRLFDEVRIS